MAFESTSEILFYEAMDGSVVVDVKIKDESVWLSLKQMANLFKRDKSVISRHIANIFKTQELAKKATVAKFATVQEEDTRKVLRDIEYFNLDVIIAVGYRVNSKQGTQFRQWASQVLKDHLIKGFSLHPKRLEAQGIKELQEAICLLENTLVNQGLLQPLGIEVIKIIKNYAKTWNLLLAYDEAHLPLPKIKQVTQALDYAQVKTAIEALKLELMQRGEASTLFAREFDQRLQGILLSIEQSFADKPLYHSVYERAAHLLYFIIKDHPFIDGNKRVACFVLLLYLQMHRIPWRLDDRGLTALALLIAESAPLQKDILIRLIVYLLL